MGTIKKYIPRKFKHIFGILKNPIYGFEYHPNSHKKVITCEEASKSREINPRNELKSIIVKIKSEFYVIHLRGTQRINSKKILNLFNIPFHKKRSFRFSSIEELEHKFDTKPGLVCPFTSKIWSCKHIISKELIESDDYFYTNDATFYGFVKFQIKILTKTKQFKIYDLIEK